MPQSKRNLYIASAVSLVLILVSIYFLFVFQKKPSSIKVDNSATEIKEVSEIDVSKRPYITLTPTSNGAEIIISIENMSNFDNIEYELTYLADNPQVSGEKIERGSTGTDVNTKDEKYKKSMLLGTASRGNSSPDRGISDGKLTMHMARGGVEYQSETKWDLLQVGISSREIKSADGNFSIKLPPLTKDYYAILADTLGVPKSGEFDIKKVQLPILAVFSASPKFTKKAQLSIKANDPASKLYIYNQADSTWGNPESKVENGALTSQIEFFSTFVVVSSK